MSEKKMTQTERVLKYIHDFGSISSKQAMNDLGIMRLASRISELKYDGWDIRSCFVSDKNRYGETVTYKKYWIEK